MDERDRSKEQRNLGDKTTADEMMVCGKYCAIRSYLPNKPNKWGIKVWCLTDAVGKYAWTWGGHLE